jgi:hypothetical protein
MFDLESLLYFEQKKAEEYERLNRERRSKSGRDLDFDHDFETFQELLAEAREAAQSFGEVTDEDVD